MSLMIAFNTAAMGAVNAAQRFDRSAGKIAEASATDGGNARDVISAFVEQKEARTAFSANLAVMKTASDMTGRLLDIKI